MDLTRATSGYIPVLESVSEAHRGQGYQLHSEHTTVFKYLDSVLTDTQNLWRPQPFTRDDLPWNDTHPQLKEALLNLSDEEVLQLHNDPQRRLSWFQQQEPELCAALYAYEPDLTDSVTHLEFKSSDSSHIPGRKWQQIMAFASALPRNRHPLVDWCAGKGHLSRVVQRSQQQPVHCLEWDASLISLGDLLSKKQNLDIRYHHHDVMRSAPAECADSMMVHIGLHACGELHHQLLRHVASTMASGIAVSPCCYHKISTARYRTLSSCAQKSDLILDRQALHLAVQDTVTARSGERRLRERERLWRLGFDALQREVRGSDDYLNVPSVLRELLRKDFPSFCQWAASRRNVNLPEKINFEHYLQLGTDKHRKVVRLELLRQLFNRPLELWLVLDCALFLEENGYRVKVTQFCDRNISPRNLLIQGEKT